MGNMTEYGHSAQMGLHGRDVCKSTPFKVVSKEEF